VCTIAFKLAVLAQNNSWYARDLLRAASNNESIDIVSYRDLIARQYEQVEIESHFPLRQPIQLSDYHALLVRSMPLGSLEQVIFRVNTLHAAQSQGLTVMNSPRTLEIAIDKWLTLATATRLGIATPKTIVCQNREQALAAFEQLDRDVVVKPLFGGEGRGIMRVSCPDLAWRVFGTLESNQSVIYLQEYVDHYGYDLRVFMLGSQHFAMKRVNKNDWRTNVARGGLAEAHLPTDQQLELATLASQALGGGILGIDLLPAKDGRLLLIEVNAVPGWKALSRALSLDISRKVLDYLQLIASK
jgi:ribosomal protein S6--L-glutamate ligase